MSVTDDSVSSHALLAPSGAPTWVYCAGSVEAQRGKRDRSSEYAAEGTAAHELAAWCLTEQRVPTEKLGVTITVVEPDQIYKIQVDEEMCHNVQAYVDYIHTLTATRDMVTAVEHRVYTDIDECSGTADFLAYDQACKQLHVVDLKYGKGHRVEVRDNLQAIIYGWAAGRGIYEKTQTFPEQITLHIFQPRINNVSSHTYTLEEFAPHVERIRKAAEAALTPGAPRTPGDAQCKWCKAKADCPELAAHVHSTVAEAFPVIDDEPVAPDALAEAMSRVDMVKQWVKAVEEKAFDVLRQGLDLPGFKLVAGRSTRKWGQGEDKVLAELKRRKLRVGDITETKLCSIAQLEKKLGREAFAKKVADLVIKPEGKPAIAREDDARPAFNPGDAFPDLSVESTGD